MLVSKVQINLLVANACIIFLQLVTKSEIVVMFKLLVFN